MTATVYSTAEVDALITDAGSAQVSLASAASGAGPTTISRLAKTTVVIATNSHGASTDGFKCDTSFGVGDIIEFFGNPTTTDGSFLVLDENNNLIGINQFFNFAAPFGARFRKIATAGGSTRNWVLLH